MPRLWIASILLLSGCLGEIGDSPKPGEDGVQPAAQTWLPARVRRLSNLELTITVQQLLGTPLTLSEMLPQDPRQSGYTANADLRVDATFGGKLQGAVDAVAEEAVSQRLGTLLSCPEYTRSCAATFIDQFAVRAFRRPLVDEERTGLLAVYDVAASGVDASGAAIGTFEDGIKAVIRAVLQSASFLYLTELGRDTGEELLELDPYETASQLSYLVAASAPDADLLAAAAQDALRTPDQREAQARRLMADNPNATTQFARMVKEWLHLDQLAELDRQSTVAESFADLRPMFMQETDAFLGEVMTREGGSLQTLLNADFTMADDKLAAFYGVPYSGSGGWVRTSISETPRRGIFGGANFLSTNASNAPASSSPVKRGNLVLNQVLCLEIHFPVDPEIAKAASVVPPPDPLATTRQRFEQHQLDPKCSSCHKILDGVGFAFEHFDQIGKFRSTENDKPIDASGALFGSDVDGPYADANELFGRLATSEQVRGCFAKNFFRFASAQTTSESEAQFMDVWRAMPTDGRGRMGAVMIGYIRSDMFMKRRAVQ